MLRKENVVLIKSRAKLCATYATFSSHKFLFNSMQHNFFQPEALKLKKNIACVMNEKFETKVKECL